MKNSHLICNVSTFYQISQSEGGVSQTAGGGGEVDRTEVATPTFSAIDLAENPLDRRALVSLKKQLEIDQPTNKLLTVSSLSVIKNNSFLTLSWTHFKDPICISGVSGPI